MPPSPAKTPRKTRPSCTRFDDGEDEQHAATLLEEAVEAAVEQLADRRIEPPQRLLDPVDGAEEVAALNRLRAAQPDRDVFRVAAEPRHLVWHHLTDGDDEVVGVVDERPIDGERKRRARADGRRSRRPLCGKLADRRHVFAPAVVEQARGVDRVAEHEPGLGGPERPMRAERRHDVDALDLALEQPSELRDDLPRTRMQTRLVGWHKQHAARPVRATTPARSRTNA